MSLLVKLVPLLAAIALGFVAGAARLFERPGTAVEVLNRYVLYVAFPLLVVGSLGSAQHAVPDGAAFYVAHLIAFGLVVGAVRATGLLRGVRGKLGGVALGGIFGNIAYVGLPFTERVLGPSALGHAAMAVALHVILSMTLGPLLLLRWSRRTASLDPRTLLRMVARQPLVWSPFVGLLIRALPDERTEPALSWLAPVGASAAPVALFMLGLYLHLHRDELRRIDLPTGALVGLKLLVFPALALAVVLGARQMGAGIGGVEAQVLVLLCAMPTAITTFSISQDYRVGRDVVARGIVLSTLLCLVTLPVVAAIVQGLASW